MEVEPGSSATTKVMGRLVPFCMLLFFVQVMDKTNVGFAALQMNRDLGFTPQVYGFGAGVFFLGAFFFEIPSNLALVRVGARRWLARIMITWGLIVIALAATRGATFFYAMRFLLGVAEAGLLPGVIYYLGIWVPKPARATALSALMSTAAIGAIAAGPIATGLMQLQGDRGLAGWQWIFIIEGIATVIIGFITMSFLPDRVEQARWLSDAEQRWLIETQRKELQAKEVMGVTAFLSGFFDNRVLLALIVSLLLVLCNFGAVFWLPQVIKSFGALSNIEVGWLSAVPYACGGIGMVLWGRHSDRTADRRWHVFIGAAAAAAGYVWAATAPNATLSFIGLCLGTAGIMSTFGIFWAHAGDLLGGAAAAGGIAFLNTAGQLGGFLGPFVIGFIRQRAHNFNGGLLFLGACALLTAFVALKLKSRVRPQGALATGAQT
jgi:ACS family tartrate transporter-like MFS transporter